MVIRILALSFLFLGVLSRTTFAVVLSDGKSHGVMTNKHPHIRCWESNGGGDAKELFEGRISSNSSSSSSTTSSSSSPQDIRDQWFETVCATCDDPPKLPLPASSPEDDDRYHAVLVFPDTAPEFIPLATGLLLTDRFRITIVRLHLESETMTVDEDNCDGNDAVGNMRGQKVEEQIMTGIPCNHPVRLRQDALIVLEADVSVNAHHRCSAGATKAKATKTTTICRGPISLKPFDSCAIQAAPTTFLTIQNYFPLDDKLTTTNSCSAVEQGKLPDVIITDATLVGAMWMSEVWGVPTVVVANPSFVSLAVEHDAAWTVTTTSAGSWSSRLWRILGQRFHSLSITMTFMEMNKMRIDFGLPPLRRPIDYLGNVAAILMEFAAPGSIPGVDSEQARASFAETQQWWERIHVTGPLQPPCFPCAIENKQHQLSSLRKSFRDKESTYYSSQKDGTKNLTVLVVQPTNPTPVWTRTILQGIFMARESLIRYDDCEWDSFSCQKPMMVFKTIWLFKEGQEDYFPSVFPEHVEREASIHLMDSLANHPGTVLAIMPCDKYAAIFEKTLDISVICIEPTDRFPLWPDQVPPSASNPRELSSKILKHLRARQKEKRNNPSTTKKTNDSASSGPESSTPNAVGSLTQAVSIIEKVAAVHRQYFPWNDITEMQRVTSQAVKNLTKNAASNISSTTSSSLEDYLDDWKPTYDNFTVLIAWIVVLASAVYIAVIEFVPSSRSRSTNFRRSHNQYSLGHHHTPSYSSSSCSDGLFTRPDLEDAWAALLEWYKEQPDSLQLIYKSITVRGSLTATLTPNLPPAGRTSPPNNVGVAGQNQRRRKKR